MRFREVLWASACAAFALSCTTPAAPSMVQAPAVRPTAEAAVARSKWQVHEAMKFHLGYFREHELAEGATSASLDFGFGDNPDITNINLHDFVGLGFPIPTRENAKEFRFFLKFYEYPATLEPTISTGDIFETLRLEKLPQYSTLRSFAANRKNVVVKKGVIGKPDHGFSTTQPYPPLRVAQSDGQADFDSSLKFSSLYLRPTSERPACSDKQKLVEWSNDGVPAFHAELLTAYRAHLREVTAQDPKHRSFVDLGSCRETKESTCTVRLLRVLEAPMDFRDNYLDLPMPHGPTSVFLTGLLLVYREDFEIAPSQATTLTTEAALRDAGSPKHQHVFEVASVVDFGECGNELPSLTLEAVRKNDADRLAALLSEGVSPNARDESGATLLHIAAGLGLERIVELLLEHGADLHVVDARMGTGPLHRAAQGGNPKIVHLLLERGAFIDQQSAVNGHTPLLDAMFYKQYAVVEYLLRADANLALRNTLGLSPSDWAKREKDGRLLRLLDDQQKRDRAQAERQRLLDAVRRGDSELAIRLIEEGKQAVDQVGKDGNTPLLLAAKAGHVAVVSALLQAGANPNKVDRLMKATPGHKAAFFGHAEVLRLLIAHGLKLDAQGPYNGYTALHDALLNGHVEATRVLVDAGASAAIAGVDGKTPRQIAGERKLGHLLDGSK